VIGRAFMHHAVLLCCFVAGYALALALELLALRVNRPAVRVLALVAGIAGLLGHSVYIYRYAGQLPLIEQRRWMLYLAWILVVFYLCGEFRQRRLPWGVFVLPVVLGLVGIGVAFGPPPDANEEIARRSGVWGPLHAVLILLAAVGVCVGFVASVMYLIQAHRLRTRSLSVGGTKLLSLERLETMNRRALVLAFPLLTAGMLAGLVLMFDGTSRLAWTDPRVLATLVLWVVFVLLLYLRFAQHLRGRQSALLTIVAFVLLLGCLVLSHYPRQGE
jgi:ABC-type transport system involved in cytochrome c biogenesis permease subunit